MIVKNGILYHLPKPIPDNMNFLNVGYKKGGLRNTFTVIPELDLARTFCLIRY